MKSFYNTSTQTILAKVRTSLFVLLRYVEEVMLSEEITSQVIVTMNLHFILEMR